MEEPALVRDEPVQPSVNLIVGGVYYSLCVADIKRVPDSYFAHLIQSHWTENNSDPAKIDRCGELFRHINFYVFAKVLDLPSRPVKDFGLLLSLRTEADFYNLPSLTHICDARINDIIKEWCQKKLPHLNVYPLYDCVQDASTKSADAPDDTLLKVLRFIRPPSVATTTSRTLGSKSYQNYFHKRNSSDWANDTSGRYTSYFVDRPRASIKALTVCPLSSLKLQSEMDYMNRSVHIYKYDAGGFCTQHTLYYFGYLGDFRIGSILCILNSEHTGGRITTIETTP